MDDKREVDTAWRELLLHRIDTIHVVLRKLHEDMQAQAAVNQTRYNEFTALKTTLEVYSAISKALWGVVAALGLKEVYQFFKP